KAGRRDELLYLPQEISDAERHELFSRLKELDESGRGAVLSTLYRLGSEPEHLAQEDEQLSPGELRKLMIALAVQRPLSLLILDEPTNHMDITSILALENALAELDCTMLVISHDRTFLQKVAGTNAVAERSGNHGELKV
ncbi:MAG: ATP-binding cassette domain-containing protein, partial [Treponema sp.]|nr:ATP-binding cassette domain-containing protein [Treponema sp.]